MLNRVVLNVKNVLRFSGIMEIKTLRNLKLPKRYKCRLYKFLCKEQNQQLCRDDA